MNNGRKFQPRISTDNSWNIIEIPQSVLKLGIYRNLESLESLSKNNPELQIFYVVTADSTKCSLKPIRDDKGGFFTILLLKEDL